MEYILNLGVVGAGGIIPFHLDALVEAGFNIKVVGAKSISERIRKLANKYQIDILANSGDQIIEFLDELDALLIAPQSEFLFHYLHLFKDSSLPILIEKPVFTHRSQIMQFSKLRSSFPNVMVGYNRRYYKTTRVLKNHILKNRAGFLFVNIPELSGNSNPRISEVLQNIRENTVHIFDLIHFLIGPYDIQDSKLLEMGQSIFALLLQIGNNGYQGMINITFGLPGNYQINFYSSDSVYELRPLEVLKIYKGMDIVEPSSSFPIRKYLPKLSEEIQIDFQTSDKTLFKPGFLDQAIAFKRFVQTGNLGISANLEDALFASNLAFELEEQIYRHLGKNINYFQRQ